ncbi:major facilitator superfamily domain-containing protein [Trichoderma breve]|uniref:Major facilitator superfamily domain-containing protein n=1 Tax=Trichoderma breve TaxID=2034170 RepID=A0A9W9BAK9_9HYPO|nr:major facilitator superfamily domain-containing protein [Trichoderma breve]KAJ4859585.1 major facilitator superfamily domain-containing protein [Trichoderma breve]
MASSSTLNAPAAFDDDKTLDIKPDERDGNSDSNSNSDVEKGQVAQAQDELDWDNAPENPYNFPGWKKALTIFALATMGLTVSIATSISSSSVNLLMEEFGVSRTVALLPLTLYVVALGLGPIIGGPLSETIGRYPVIMGGLTIGALWTLGAGFVHNFGALCFFRFLSGFFWAPILANAPGSISETFMPKTRGPVSAIFILTPFLGPGLGPVIGSFVSVDKGWRWTEWTMLFFSVFSIGLGLMIGETFHPVLKRRLAKKKGIEMPPLPPMNERIKTFAVVAAIRPVKMLFTEPIVTFICLYVAVDFGTLFSFFGGVPYTFGTVYHFTTDQSGLVFISIVIGCFLGLATIMACEIFLYRKQIPNYPPHKVPPEHRLYPAMLGSFGLPLGLFCTMQYTTDTFTGNVVASASSANSLARYGFAGVFPLFTIQMYTTLGIDWASSLLGFIALALIPIPWVLFKFGPKIRAKSRFETHKYE